MFPSADNGNLRLAGYEALKRLAEELEVLLCSSESNI